MFARIEIDESRCKGCGLCTISCPRMLLSLSDETAAAGYTSAFLTSEDKCVGCALCAGMCPDTAIKVYSRQKNEFTGNLGRSFILYTRIASEKAIAHECAMDYMDEETPRIYKVRSG